MEISRRTFIVSAAVGSAALVASKYARADGEDAGKVLPTKGKFANDPLPTNGPRLTGKYQPKCRVGLGGVAIGNAFAPMSDEAASATLQQSWVLGARYFDTSPWYGLGLSERRFGRMLHNQARDEYVLSTKVGRLFQGAQEPAKTPLWKNADTFSYIYDYTAEGVRRSVEDSLQRLGVGSIDIVFIHDLSPDNQDLKEKWTEQFEIAAKGAMPELTRMREEGLIKAWGLGVNTPEPALKTIERADPDIFLLALQYSLLDHEEALRNTLPTLQEKGISVVVGAPLNSGYLAGRERYNYKDEIPAGIAEKRAKMTEIAGQHGIDLRTAALQFCNAHPAVSAVIPGARTPEQVAANVQSFKVKIPNAFWEDLKRGKLIAQDAPVPKV